MNPGYTAPEFEKTGFTCPYCGVLADQYWSTLYADSDVFPIMGSGVLFSAFGPPRKGLLQANDSPTTYITAYISVCRSCREFALWIDNRMVHPHTASAPLPSPDMPDETREFYEEARRISDESPRAAAALLRLALEKLMECRDVLGKTLNEQIGSLVKEGTLSAVQESLDAVRVIGSDQIHDLGEIQLDEDTETAVALFELVNFAVEKMITEPEKVKQIYEALPESKRKAIEERDSRE